MKKGCIKVAGCGCISCIVAIWTVIIYIFVYTYSPEETLYYIEDVDMYVLFDRNNGGNEGCVYLGETLEDIDKKLDGFKVNRTYWDTHSANFNIDCTKDSIFVIASEEKGDTVVSSTNYVICLLRPIVKEITCYGLDGEESTSRVGFGHDTKRFRANPNNYIHISYNWDAFWHEKNPLEICFLGKPDSSCIKYIDPIER